MMTRTRRQPVPTDCCPHASGRAGGFAGCPAFAPVVERPSPPDVPGLDLDPPTPVLTCVHLTYGVVDDGRFYPRCGLGPPEARRQKSA